MSNVFSLPSHITLIADPKVLEIPIKDNQEMLIDLTKQKAICYGPSPEIPENKNYIFLRKTVYEKLKKANESFTNLDGSKNIPPHSTGGAIDVYLVDDAGQPLEMGIHPKDWMKDKYGSLSLTNSSRISQGAKNNRAMMSRALSQAGFVNYPTEYWHWSYGDRYWAFASQQPAAIYGSISYKE